MTLPAVMASLCLKQICFKYILMPHDPEVCKRLRSTHFDASAVGRGAEPKLHYEVSGKYIAIQKY